MVFGFLHRGTGEPPSSICSGGLVTPREVFYTAHHAVDPKISKQLIDRLQKKHRKPLGRWGEV